MIVSKFGFQIAEVTEDLPQNVGFAIRGGRLEHLLQDFSGETRLASVAAPEKVLALEEVAAAVQNSVVMVLAF